ncbi:MFS transporter [Streptomyces narbonensis]
MIHVPTNAAATARLAEHSRGRYQGVMGMSWAVAGFIAPIAAGAIVDGPGPDVLWTATAAIGVAAAIGYYTRLRKALADEDAPTQQDVPSQQDGGNIGTPAVVRTVEVVKSVESVEVVDSVKGQNNAAGASEQAPVSA